jgi:hypothetical protein
MKKDIQKKTENGFMWEMSLPFLFAKFTIKVYFARKLKSGYGFESRTKEMACFDVYQIGGVSK